MLSALSTTRSRRITLVLWAVFCLTLVAALVLGGPGTARGNRLLFVAAGVLIVAFVHPWRRVREFKHLFYAAGLGFAFFVTLHGLADMGAGAVGSAPVQAMLQLISVAAFFVAVFACPPALVIGLGGMVAAFLTRRMQGGAEPPAHQD